MSTEKDTPQDPNAPVLAALARIEARLDETNDRLDAGFKELRAEVGGELRLGLVDLRTEVREGQAALQSGQASILNELHGTREEAGKELAEHNARIKSLERPKRTGTR
jgi:hypothetical protein